jgi:hypothetical protein
MSIIYAGSISVIVLLFLAFGLARKKSSMTCEAVLTDGAYTATNTEWPGE